MNLSLALLLTLLLLSGCASQEIQRKDGNRSARPYSLANLAKSDVDMISELSQREAIKSLKLVAEKLYRRNPSEYRKAGMPSPEAAAARIFEHLDQGRSSPLALMNWQDNFGLAFQEGYNGDRVYAFMTAMTAMTLAAYDFKTAFFFTDQLDPQKLYNSARNIEVAVWKLSNARLANGNRVLISNSLEGDVQNLSFEREFGKLIAIQDMLALIVEDRTSRAINRVVQGLVFLPI